MCSGRTPTSPMPIAPELWRMLKSTPWNLLARKPATALYTPPMAYQSGLGGARSVPAPRGRPCGAPPDEPAWALGHEQHSDGEQQSRDGREAEHPAPGRGWGEKGAARETPV